jgi:hypothetical protein
MKSGAKRIVMKALTSAFAISALGACNVGTISVDATSGGGARAAATPLPPLTLSSTSVTLSSLTGFINPAPIFDPSVADVVRNSHRSVTLHLGSGASAHEVVMVVGGETQTSTLSSTLIYDPSTNTWSAGIPMNHVHAGFTANTIKLGVDHHEGILVVGGFENSSGQNYTEFYDPTGSPSHTPIWIIAAPLNQARGNHTAVNLSDGRVMVVGGSTDYYSHAGTMLNAAEIYDPGQNTWTTVAPDPAAIISHVSVLIKIGADLHDGVLSLGGFDGSTTLTSAYIYDTAVGDWLSAGNLPVDPTDASAVVLPNGSVIVSGGQGSNYAKFSQVEVYVPSHTGAPSTTWTPLRNMIEARYGHSMILFPNNTLLSVGGYGGGAITSAETYSIAGNSWVHTGDNLVFRYHHSSSLLSDGRLLVFGGQDTGSNTQANSTEIFRTYDSVIPVPTSGVAPYTYTLKSGLGHVYSNGRFVPDQFTPGVSVLTVTDSLGSTADFTITTTP